MQANPTKNYRRKQVRRACSNCRNAHAGCTNQRPCKRCVKKGLQDSCREWDGNSSNTSIPTTNTSNNTNVLPLKRSRDQFCNHGWDSSDSTFLSNIIDNDPFSFDNYSYQQEPSEDFSNLVFRASDSEEIYSSLNTNQKSSSCPLCIDCNACEGKLSHKDSSERQQVEIRQLQDEILKLRDHNKQLQEQLNNINNNNIKKEQISNNPQCIPSGLSYYNFNIPKTLQDIPSYNINKIYRFNESIKDIIPRSCWLVKNYNRADKWTLLECNQAFINLINIPSNILSNSFSLLDLAPERFKSSSSELLQQIINANVNTAKAKTLWKLDKTEICVETNYKIYTSTNESDNNSNNNSNNNNMDIISSDIESNIDIVNYSYTIGSCTCETTGCGTFNTNWNPNKNNNTNNDNSTVCDPGCSDLACISVPDRIADRIICTTHKKVNFYDDYIQIGDTVHEKTFSIQVATILALMTTQSSEKLKTKRN